jgi:hypothetical protein
MCHIFSNVHMCTLELHCQYCLVNGRPSPTCTTALLAVSLILHVPEQEPHFICVGADPSTCACCDAGNFPSRLAPEDSRHFAFHAPLSDGFAAMTMFSEHPKSLQQSEIGEPSNLDAENRQQPVKWDPFNLHTKSMQQSDASDPFAPHNQSLTLSHGVPDLQYSHPGDAFALNLPSMHQSLSTHLLASKRQPGINVLPLLPVVEWPGVAASPHGVSLYGATGDVMGEPMVSSKLGTSGSQTPRTLKASPRGKVSKGSGGRVASTAQKGLTGNFMDMPAGAQPSPLGGPG